MSTKTFIKRTISVATNNVMSLPKNRHIDETLAATPSASVILVQEIDLPEFKRAIEHVKGYNAVEIPDSDIYNAGALYDPKRWAYVNHKYVDQYSGKKGISKTRHIAMVGLRHLGLNQIVIFISFHDVTKGEDSIRKGLRRQGRRQVRRLVRRARRAGLPVVVGGDLNQIGTVFPTADVIRKTGYDHLYFWNSKRARWRAIAARAIRTASDHKALIVRLILTKENNR